MMFFTLALAPLITLAIGGYAPSPSPTTDPPLDTIVEEVPDDASVPRGTRLVKDKLRALEPLAGSWTYTAKFTEGPSKGKDAYHGEARVGFVHDDHHLRADHRFVQGGKTHTATVIITFDPGKQKYTMFSFRSGPAPFVYEGDLNEGSLDWTKTAPASPRPFVATFTLGGATRTKTWTARQPDGKVHYEIVERFRRRTAETEDQ